MNQTTETESEKTLHVVEFSHTLLNNYDYNVLKILKKKPRWIILTRKNAQKTEGLTGVN